MADEIHAPVWAREEAFPEKPTSGAFSLYGFVNSKGQKISAESLADLTEKISKSREGVSTVWSPENDRMQVPEEVQEIRSTLWKRRRDWAEGDISDGKRMCALFGVALLWSLFAGFQNRGGDIILALQSPQIGVVAIMLLILGLLPLYEGWKTLKKGEPKSEAEWQAEVEESRFDNWLSNQKIIATWFAIGVMVVSGLIQLYLERGLDWSALSVAKAGLIKGGDVEWWRYLTGPLLHGNLLHWLMNAGGLLYLGRRVELLARWPHVIIVLVGSAWFGGIMTSYLMSKPSIGASGGIMGLLGFLLVFESLHTRLVPKSSRKRLLAGVIGTVLMGILGFQFIDNAAHAGGLVAGMAYALIGFPVSKSPRRPAILKQDRLIALAMGGVIVGGLVLVFVKLLFN